MYYDDNKSCSIILSNKRLKTNEKTETRAAERNTSRGRLRWAALGAVVVAIAAAATWFCWRGEDPQVAKVKQLQAQIFENREQLPQEERGRLMTELREARDQLTDEQRQQTWDEMRQQGMRRMQERIDGYFELPPAERVAFLDQQIRESEARRKEFAARQKQRDAEGDRGSNRPGGREANAGRPGGGGPGGARPGGRGRGGAGRDNEQRMERRRGMLDATSPEQRAKFSQYIEDHAGTSQATGVTRMAGPGTRRAGPILVYSPMGRSK